MTTHYVTTMAEQIAALKKAKRGDIIWFEEGPHPFPRDNVPLENEETGVK